MFQIRSPNWLKSALWHRIWLQGTGATLLFSHIYRTLLCYTYSLLARFYLYLPPASVTFDHMPARYEAQTEGRSKSMVYSTPPPNMRSLVSSDPIHTPLDAATLADEDSEDWTSLVDPGQRRRLQNRVAQRNYRRRQKNQKEAQRSVASNNHSIHIPTSRNNNDRNHSKTAHTRMSSPAYSYRSPSTPTPPSSSHESTAFSDGSIVSNASQELQFACYGDPNNSLVPYPQLGSPFFDLSKTLQSYELEIPHISLGASASLEKPYNRSYSEGEQREQPLTSSRAISPSPSHTSLKDCNAKETLGLTPLQTASFFGRDTVVAVLLEKGADVDGVSANGLTALHIATTQGCNGAVEILLRSGAFADAQDSSGRTALHLAAQSDCEAMVRTLLDNGSHIEAADYSGTTALHVAAHHGHHGIIRSLLERGARVNSKDRSGRTALHRAAEQGHGETVRLLVDYKADINGL